MTRKEKKPIVQMGNKGSVTNKTHFPREKETKKKSGRSVKKRKKPKENMTPSITCLSFHGGKKNKNDCDAQ